MRYKRRVFLVGLCASFAPSAALARRWRIIGSVIEAVLVGAVSGYVAARIAENKPTHVLVERSWHSGDRLKAPVAFRAMDYPTEEIVQVHSGDYEVKSASRVDIGRNESITVLVVKDHVSERYVGVAYA